MNKVIVLGSSSPSRRLQMAQLGIDFVSDSANIDETPHPNESPEALVTRLSIAKAKKVAASYSNALVIGCDQVCSHKQVVYGKPLSHETAIEQLSTFSGQTVTFHAGICLLNTETDEIQHDIIDTQVTFRTISIKEIENYLLQDTPYQCAGSIRSEGRAVWLIEQIKSNDPNALMGLPLLRLCKMLRNAES